MARVFVWECICSGIFGNDMLGSHLLDEGRAMLSAILTDLKRSNQARVSTVVDARLGLDAFPADEIELSESIEHEARLFDRMSASADVVFIVAPESGGILADRIARCENHGVSPANVSSHAARILGDKLQTAAILEELGIRTPPTSEFLDFDDCLRRFQNRESEVVIKPVDGAGAEQTWLIDLSEPEEICLHSIARARRSGVRFIQQPWIKGSARSVAFLASRVTKEVDVLCQCRQNIRISGDGAILYFGGTLTAEPVPDPIASAVELLTDRLALNGYLSIDFVIPEDASSPALIEVNPRLTTSYLGYRHAYGPELANRIVGQRASLQLRPQHLEFAFSKQKIEMDLL